MAKNLYTNVDVSNFNLSYYLIENENGYGIEVEKISNSKVQESEAIYDISTDKDDMKHLLSKISDGKVTPTTLYDIVTDYINS